MDETNSLQMVDSQEQSFSLELGEVVVNEVKLELVCEDERADEAARIIQENGHAGQKIANWVCIIDVGESYPIDRGQICLAPATLNHEGICVSRAHVRLWL